MKKSLILVGMLAVGYANAQDYRVGINTDDPKATLHIKGPYYNSDISFAYDKTQGDKAYGKAYTKGQTEIVGGICPDGGELGYWGVTECNHIYTDAEKLKLYNPLCKIKKVVHFTANQYI